MYTRTCLFIIAWLIGLRQIEMELSSRFPAVREMLQSMNTLLFTCARRTQADWGKLKIVFSQILFYRSFHFLSSFIPRFYELLPGICNGSRTKIRRRKSLAPGAENFLLTPRHELCELKGYLGADPLFHLKSKPNKSRRGRLFSNERGNEE